MLRRAVLVFSLLIVSQAQATVRLGDPLPPHPWAMGQPENPDSDERELVVLYSHDCGDMGKMWPALLQSGLPIHAVNAEDVATPAPQGISVWHGPEATAFSRALKVSTYPAVILVRGGRVLNAWEGVGAVGKEVSTRLND